ncbi:MAG TPA: carboxypeptidase-like regulatory domain-containing protein [Actinomycetota bacterium]|nr:carboxypeptidase-like regulatory domain-containing protein [Actinomycetota bacterium]
MLGRSVTAAALAAAVVAAAPAPAGAAARGTVVARVVRGDTGRPVQSARVTLIAGRSGSTERTTERGVTSASGRVRFDALRTGDDRFYSIDARYDGGYFAGGNVALPDDTARPPVVEATLRVWPTTSDPAAILVARDDVFALQADDGTVAVIESVTVLNQTERAYVGRGAANGGGGVASLGFALPDGAAERGVRVMRSSVDMPEIRPTEYGFATTVAIPPGETQTTFTYSVPGSGGLFELGRTALYPVVRLSVHASEPLEIRSNRLRASGEVTVGGRTYRRWTTSEAVDPGAPVQIVAAAEAGAGGALAWGAAALAALVAIVVAAAAVRARRRGPRPERAPSAPDGRRELLVEIAQLDLARERGEVSDDAWARRRSELKDRLAEHAASQPR